MFQNKQKRPPTAENCANSQIENCIVSPRQQVKNYVGFQDDFVHLRKMRDVFKQQTSKNAAEVSTKLEAIQRQKCNEAIKAELLLKHNSSIITQLDEQRRANSNLLQDTIKRSKELTKKFTEPKQQSEIVVQTERSIKQLLDDLKH